MINVNQKINPYLAVVLICMTGLVFTFLILSSIDQPSGLDIGRGAVNTQQ
jgi:hypothetical protein